jgi:iron(III) transport system substrate-binding protein
MHNNDVRLYDGNSAVVRAVSQGEIDAGITDTDDVVAGQRERWPVDMSVEPIGFAAWGLSGRGTLVIPNTAALVKGGPHPKEAAALLDFLLSAKVEELLAKSESQNRPIRSKLAQQMGELPIPELEIPDFKEIHKAVPAAMKACTEILGE